MATFGRRRKYRAPQNRNLPSDTTDPFDRLTLHIPRALLREMVRIKGKYKVEDDIDLSTMICIALDNEMQAANPFDNEIIIDLSETYQPLAYADEAGKLLEFLRRFPKGCTIQTLFHCRWNYGIPDIHYVKRGLRELIETEMVEFFQIGGSEPSNRIRVKGLTPQDLKGARYRRIKGIKLAGTHTILDKDIGD